MAIKATNNKAAWGKFAKGFATLLVESGKHLDPQGASMMNAACENWLQEQDSQWPRGAGRIEMNLNTGKTQRSYGAYRSGYRGGNEDYPWYTGNLHDSVATVVTDGGRIVGIRQMAPGATVGQYDKRFGYIDGVEEGARMAARASHVLFPGIVARLVIGVPYTDDVNKSPAHAGFADELQRDFARVMSNAIHGEYFNGGFDKNGKWHAVADRSGLIVK